MERTRHMVEIADSSWEKLERLAYRLDAAQYIYKGRPRYGKLLELAIEKLEDSTMEWTEEEIPGEQGYDIIGALEDVLQDATIEMPPKGYTFGYNTPQGEPVYYKEKSKDIKFTLSAKPIDPDLLKETQKTVDKAMAIHLEKAVKEAIVSGKPKKPPQITWETKTSKTNQDGTKSTELFLYVAAALDDPYSVHFVILDAIADGLNLKYITGSDIKHFVKSISNYQDSNGRTVFLVELDNLSSQVSIISLVMYPVKAIEKHLVSPKQSATPTLDAFKKNALPNIFGVDDVASSANETAKSTAKLAQLLKDQELAAQGYAGHIPKKQVSCQHKIEKAIDKNGTLQEYDTYSIKVNLSPFDAIALNDNKHEIADRLKILLLNGHGYPIHGAIAGARILWDDDHDGTIRISASIIRKLSSPFKGYSQEFIGSSIKYLENTVTAIQNHHAIKSESYNPPL